MTTLTRGAPKMNKKYIVTLSAEERRELEHLVTTGKGAARKLLRALDPAQGRCGPAGLRVDR